MSISFFHGIVIILLGIFLMIFDKYYLNNMPYISFILKEIIAKFFLFLGIFVLLYRLT